MIIERNEDVFSALKDMAGDIHLVSRNYNDELIGIHFYANLNVLTKCKPAIKKSGHHNGWWYKYFSLFQQLSILRRYLVALLLLPSRAY